MQSFPPPTFQNNNQPDSDATVVLTMFWRHWFHILVMAAIGIACGGIYLRQQPAEFQSSSQILVVQRLAKPSNIDDRFTNQNLATQAKLLESPLILRQLVRPLLSSKQLPEDGTTGIVNSIIVKVEENLITLSLRGPEPEYCRDILAGVIAGYDRFLKDSPNSNNEESIKHLTAKTKQLEQQLRSDQLRLRQWLEGTPFSGSDGEIQQKLEERIDLIEAKRSDLKVRRVTLESQLQLYETEIAGMSAPNTISTGSSESTGVGHSELARQLLSMEIKARQVAEQARGNHPEVKKAAKELEMLRQLHQQVANEEKLVTIQNELVEIEHTEFALTELLKGERDDVRRWSKLDAKTRGLNAEIAFNQEYYDLLRSDLRQLEGAGKMGGSTVSIIAPPEDGIPSGPNVQLILGLSFVLGVFCGVVFSVILEFSDQGFQSPDDVRKRLGVPIIGQVPFVPQHQDSEDLPSANNLLVDYRRSQSDHAEAFRSIRTKLQFGGDNLRHQIIQVTSPRNGDGKTNVAANLAVATAQIGKKTLLVDADFGSPQVSRTFAPYAERGLANFLEGKVEWQAIIKDTDIDSLDIVPTGPLPLNPTELLSSKRFREFLLSVRDSYEHVYIDSPALLEVLSPCLVAHEVDGLLLTIRVGSRSRPEAEQAFEVLGPLAKRVVGIVMNNPDDRRRPWRADPFKSFHRYPDSFSTPQPNEQFMASIFRPSIPVNNMVATESHVDESELKSETQQLKAMLQELKEEVRQVIGASTSVDAKSSVI